MNNTNYLLGLSLFVSFLLISTFAFCQTLYVDVNASGSNNGSSWTNAYTDLQDALDENMNGPVDTILLASGTYLPTQIPDSSKLPLFRYDPGSAYRFFAFHLADSNVVIIGGYNSSTGIKMADPSQTILSGYDPTYKWRDHIMVLSDVDSSTIIKNLTFKSGGSKNSGSSNSVTMSFDGKTFTSDKGGGLNIQNSEPMIVETDFNICVRILEGQSTISNLLPLCTTVNF